MNSGIILMAGSGERSLLDYNKVFYDYLGKPLFIHSLDAFYNHQEIDEIVLVINPQDEQIVKTYLEFYEDIKIVYGGATRNQSLQNALKEVNSDKIIVHDAARPSITKNDIKRIIDSLDEFDLSTLYHKVVDTIKDGRYTLNRDNLKAVTTPQGFTKKCIPLILENNQNVLDELQIFENNLEYKIGFVEETHDNKKFTNPIDFEKVDYDFKSLKQTKWLSMYMSLRGLLIDELTNKYLSNNKNITVIHLGCGLDSRCLRIKENYKMMH